MSKNVESANKI